MDNYEIVANPVMAKLDKDPHVYQTTVKAMVDGRECAKAVDAALK